MYCSAAKRSTELWPQVTVTFWKFGHMVSEVCEWTDKHAHALCNNPLPYRAGVIGDAKFK